MNHDKSSIGAHSGYYIIHTVHSATFFLNFETHQVIILHTCNNLRNQALRFWFMDHSHTTGERSQQMLPILVHVHENSKRLIFQNQSQPREAIPMPTQAHIHNIPVQKAEPLRSLALRTTTGTCILIIE